MGPRVAGRPGADDRAPQGLGRAAAAESDEFDDARRVAGCPPTATCVSRAPSTNGGAALLRRGYSFTDGLDDRLGQLDAGLFFLSFQRDPEAFVRVQRQLGSADALNEYIKHVGSGVFAIPPGVRRGGYVGEGLFAG